MMSTAEILKGLDLSAVNAGGSTGTHWWTSGENTTLLESVNPATGETIAQLHQATGAMVKLDLKKAQKSRDALRSVPIPKLIEICKAAAKLYLEDTLPCGNGSLSPADDPCPRE